MKMAELQSSNYKKQRLSILKREINMKDVIKSKIWRILLISIMIGIIISIITFVSTYFIAKGTNEWTLEMGNTVFWIDVILATVLFILTGLFCLRDMGKMDIAKSATVVVIYYIVIIGLEQLLLSVGQYPFILLWLFIPVRLYSVIYQMLLRFTEISVWIGLLPSIIAPFLYVVFGKTRN